MGPKTTFNKTHCICQIGSKEDLVIDRVARSTESQKAVVPRKRTVVKRATFAGGFFVAPNPIDFSKAFAGFTNLSENPVCFSVVLSIFGVYLILLFWARREDRKDIERVRQYGLILFRSSCPWLFLEKGVLKICSKFTVEHRC